MDAAPGPAPATQQMINPLEAWIVAASTKVRDAAIAHNRTGLPAVVRCAGGRQLRFEEYTAPQNSRYTGRQEYAQALSSSSSSNIPEETPSAPDFLQARPASPTAMELRRYRYHWGLDTLESGWMIQPLADAAQTI